jgi:hypothetical protein
MMPGSRQCGLKLNLRPANKSAYCHPGCVYPKGSNARSKRPQRKCFFAVLGSQPSACDPNILDITTSEKVSGRRLPHCRSIALGDCIGTNLRSGRSAKPATGHPAAVGDGAHQVVQYMKLCVESIVRQFSDNWCQIGAIIPIRCNRYVPSSDPETN